MRTEEEARAAIERYADTVWRICLIQLKNTADAEDVFQTVFLRYALSAAAFESEEHEKSWLIRVALNACRDLQRSFFRSRTVPLDALMETPAPAAEDHREVLEAVLSLPEKYRTVILLHFYEGYTAPEMAKLLRKNVNSVYTLLTRAKKQLAAKLGGDWHE